MPARAGARWPSHYGAAPLLVNTLLHDNTAWTRAGAVYVGHRPRPLRARHAHRQPAPSIADIYARTAGGIDHYHSPAPLRRLRRLRQRDQPPRTATRSSSRGRSTCIDQCNVEGLRRWVSAAWICDPQFLARRSTGRGDLSAASPCRDAGDLAAASPWLPETDLAGRDPRLAGRAGRPGLL
jgi:hypothetical protein